MVETEAAGAAGAKRGRRTDGGQAKEAIQQAARQLFAEHGFDRTSVRQVALSAGVDPMLVTHYFKTKAGLFAAVVQPPVDPQVAIDFALEEGPEHVGERLARFVLRTLETPESQKWIVAMVRAATAEPEVAAVVRERMAEPMVIPLAKAAGGDDPEYRAMLVITQLLGAGDGAVHLEDRAAGFAAGAGCGRRLGGDFSAVSDGAAWGVGRAARGSFRSGYDWTRSPSRISASMRGDRSSGPEAARQSAPVSWRKSPGSASSRMLPSRLPASSIRVIASMTGP